MHMHVTRLACCIVTSALIGCGGGGGDDGGTTGPPPPPPPGTGQTLGTISTNVSSINIAAGNTQTITVSALDTQGQPIANPGTPAFSVASTGATVAEVDAQGVVLGIGSGSTTVNVSLTLGSVTRTTTVAVTVTGILPSVASVSTTSGDFFTPNKVVIGQGGSVTWTFGVTIHNVNFAGTPGAPSRIDDAYSTSASRTFTQPGNFTYNCTIHAGMSGQVIVR
jgi:plastocyanin